ncbi:hypothetical protein C2E23DRAFT_892139 [Lenzites betulinus]|nr:hypothetical protein C2E23DRAFT_892139 [Lenzites betulinus]
MGLSAAFYDSTHMLGREQHVENYTGYVHNAHLRNTFDNFALSALAPSVIPRRAPLGIYTHGSPSGNGLWPYPTSYESSPPFSTSPPWTPRFTPTATMPSTPVQDSASYPYIYTLDSYSSGTEGMRTLSTPFTEPLRPDVPCMPHETPRDRIERAIVDGLLADITLPEAHDNSRSHWHRSLSEIKSMLNLKVVQRCDGAFLT